MRQIKVAKRTIELIWFVEYVKKRFTIITIFFIYIFFFWKFRDKHWHKQAMRSFSFLILTI